ncbi:putative copper resistance protein D [Bacillus sp. OV166]|uniref:copper resistance D family protein n=1 Tax=Bacillus sp. OV166 TaxID=1882763 RepID=UPI000A2AD0F0|nr:CopD family protein [Bacillus sp. OV166]SMQ84564.1 putative copper resistance protein D [Bacillus sp. OV166]
MGFVIPITEFGSYLLYSILVGHVALQFVPEANKPKINIPKPVLLLSTLGLIIFSLGPIIQTVSYFQDGIGLALATKSVLLDFQVGRAWILIGLIATCLYLTILLNGSKYIQSLLLLLMILTVGYSSHVASLSFWAGLLSHSIHFLLVTLWTGILINVAWFSKEETNWSKFLRWFTPFAVLCLIIILLSGIYLMLFLVEPKDYVKAWVLPYGQMLLLKHISIIPVLVFAFINGVLSRKSLKISSFNPRPWIRGESVILLFVFYFTAVMGTLSPPHEVEFTVKSEGASKWVEWLWGKNILSTLQVHLAPSFQSLLLVILSMLFLLMILFSFKQKRPILAVALGVTFIIVLYMGLMFSLSI